MDAQDLSRFEALCEQLYQSHDADTRANAEKTLLSFTQGPDLGERCRFVLDSSSNPFALLVAATALTKVMSQETNMMTMQQRLDIRNYVLNYLYSHAKLPSFVVQAFTKLLARVTKLGWMDLRDTTYVFRDITDEVRKFMQQQESVEHCVMGIRITLQLVVEMNQADCIKSMSRFRKISASFRDHCLYDIFTISCSLLQQASQEQINPDDDDQSTFLLQLLLLVQNCLGFDFIGCSVDESTDEYNTVAVPTPWRPAFLDNNNVQLFFGLYHRLAPEVSARALACLVLMASVRRSLFTVPERAKFLDSMMTGVRTILESPQKLANPEAYHEFCRLLVRLKANFQLVELMQCDCYNVLIQLVAKFTISSLESWQFSMNSIHYLLSLWQRLVASVPYVSCGDHMIESLAPEIAKAYIESRVNSVAAVLSDGAEDPLDDLEALTQQLTLIAPVSRCDYEKTAPILISLFDTAAQHYQRALQNNMANEIELQEGRLTWLVHLIHAGLCGRISITHLEEWDTIDADMSYRVFQLMQVADSRLQQGHGNAKLDLAFLMFIEEFKRVYIGDQLQRSPLLYRRLSELMCLNNEEMAMELIVRKIIANLKYWTHHILLDKTLELLLQLATGYTSGRKLSRLESIKMLLENHSSEHFPFLSSSLPVNQQPFPDMRLRTKFYSALTRVLFERISDFDGSFDQFVSPLKGAIEQIGGHFSSWNATSQQDAVKRALIGVCRDLRGVVASLGTRTAYQYFFDFIYPAYMPVFHRAMELWYHDPSVTSPLLKLLVGMVTNESQRLQFSVSSANGVLLVREASQMLVTYGTHLLAVQDIPDDRLYPLKLKGVTICFDVLRCILVGHYVNFGVSRLYGDNAFDNALNVILKLAMTIGHEILLQYTKLQKAYFGLVNALAEDHMEFIGMLELPVLTYLFRSLLGGLTSLNTATSSNSCSALDYIMTFVFKLYKKQVPSSQVPLLQALDLQPDMTREILSTILKMLMFDECKNQWSMSRPLFALILVNEEYFTKLRNDMIAMLPIARQGPVCRCFEVLMDGVERSLSARNRDVFTQNLSRFREQVYVALTEQGGQPATTPTMPLTVTVTPPDEHMAMT